MKVSDAPLPSKALGGWWNCFGWVNVLKRPLTGIAGTSGNDAVELGLRTESLRALCSQRAASCPGSGEVLDSGSPAQQEVGAPSAGFASAKSAKVKQQQSGFRTARVTSAANSVCILLANCWSKIGGINPSYYFQGKWRRTGSAFKVPGKISEARHAKRVDVSYHVAQRAVEFWIENGLLEEATGQRRNRIFVAQEVFKIMASPSLPITANEPPSD